MTYRILHIYKDYFPVLGGIENHLRELAEAQAAAGHDVTVLVNSLDGRTRLEEMNGVHIIKAARLATVASTPISLAMPGLLSRLRPDLVHLQFPYPWGEVCNLFFGRAPKIIISYQSDIVKQQGILRLYQPLLRRVLQRADRIIANNPRYIDSSPYLLAVKDRCIAIPIGVHLERFTSVDAASVAEIRQRYPGPLLLFVGRLRYYKGLEYLLEAMRGVEATLLIVGDGPMRPILRQYVTKHGLDGRVHFLPDVDDAMLPAYYQACDLFVLPSSLRSEAYGIVLVEAMASGKPMVTTELGTGTSWINKDGETGIVVPPADPTALAAAIRMLLSDEGLRARMGQAARQRAFAEFGFQRMVERIDALYRELLVEP